MSGTAGRGLAAAWRRLAAPAALAVAALSSAAAAAAADTGYAVAVPVFADVAGQGLYRVPLPLDVLRRLRSAERHDLRVVNAAGEPLPFAWAGVPAAPAAAPQRVDLPRFVWPAAASSSADDGAIRVELRADGAVLRVERRGAPRPAAGGGAAQWLADLSALGEPRPQALELHWRARPGVVAAVQVFASADARAWRPVGEATVLELHDAASGQAVVQRRVELRALERAERYLRLQFAAPLALERVQAELPRAAPPPLVGERLRALRSGAREWTVDAGAVLPVARLQVHLPQDNAVLPLAVARRAPAAAGGAAAGWVPVGAHTAYRVVRDGAVAVAPPFELGRVGAREWRFVLDARVAPPESGLEVTLWWPAVELVFAARGPAPFRLLLGRDGAPPAAIERQLLIPGYREGDEFGLPLARLGAAVEVPPRPRSFGERLAEAGPEQRRRWVLWATLAAAVVVLALLAWRLARDLRRPA